MNDGKPWTTKRTVNLTIIPRLSHLRPKNRQVLPNYRFIPDFACFTLTLELWSLLQFQDKIGEFLSAGRVVGCLSSDRCDCIKVSSVALQNESRVLARDSESLERWSLRALYSCEYLTSLSESGEPIVGC
jgi:hypothetical protein